MTEKELNESLGGHANRIAKVAMMVASPARTEVKMLMLRVFPYRSNVWKRGFLRKAAGSKL